MDVTSLPNRLRAVLDANGLRPEHPPDAQQEAEALAMAPGIDAPDLTDLRALPFVTVDERWSLDLDQAVFVERAPPGWVVWYAIADAAWFVGPTSALFAEALRRGASYYLPGVVVPMLPRVLSEDVVSIGPDVDRRALVFRVALDAAGATVDARLMRARVRSRAKLAWSDVQALYDQGTAPCADVGVTDSLRALQDVGRLLLQRAADRDVVRYRRTEMEIRVDGAGARFIAYADVRTDVERYNEQISLLCNVQGARILKDKTPGGLVQPIFRVHEPPEPGRIAALGRSVAQVVRAHGLPATWLLDPSEALDAWLSRLPDTGPHARVAAALHRQALVSNGRASFSADPGRHFGVGADLYARFTAPMREVVGVYLHNEVVQDRPDRLPSGFAQPDALRDAVIDAANRARDVQRRLDQEANRLVLDQLFEDDVAHGRPLRTGTVMGLSHGKVHVQLDDPPVDVKVYVVHLEKQRGTPLLIDRGGACLRRRKGGKIALTVGDAVRVRVLDRDHRRDRWALDCVPVGG